MNRLRALVLACAGATSPTLPPAVFAEEPPPHSAKREWRDTLGVSFNQLGIQNSLDLSWTWPLSESKNPLLSDAHLSLGATHAITPSYMRLGAWVEVSPLSVLDLRAGIEPAAYFGTFGSLLSFGSYADNFDNDTRKALKERAKSDTARRAYLAPTLKFKAGPMVAASSAELEWWRSGADGPLFYEPARDTLLEVDGDRMLNTSSVLLFQHDSGRSGKLSVGFNHRLSYVFDAPANRIQRVGLLVIREFGGRRFHLDRPTLIGNLAYYLDDPFKKHQLTAVVALAIKSAR